MMGRRRREFSNEVRRQAFARSGDICECARVPSLPTYGTGCGVALVTGAISYEHIVCDALEGEPTLENCACLTKTCWRLKTDTHDLPAIAKDRRQRDRNAGIRRIPDRVLPGTFRSGIKLPMHGGPLDRATLKPWRPSR
jgi:hypothetical protein